MSEWLLRCKQLVSRGLGSLIIDSTEAPQRTLETLPFAISFQRSLPRYRYSGTGVWNGGAPCLHLGAADTQRGGGSGSGSEGSMQRVLSWFEFVACQLDACNY